MVQVLEIREAKAKIQVFIACVLYRKHSLLDRQHFGMVHILDRMCSLLDRHRECIVYRLCSL